MVEDLDWFLKLLEGDPILENPDFIKAVEARREKDSKEHTASEISDGLSQEPDIGGMEKEALKVVIEY